MKELRNEDFLEFMGDMESQYIAPASDFLDELLNYDSYRAEGDLLPWEKTHETIQFRPGELSIWGGYNGSGKSQILSNAILSWLHHSRAVIASLEMRPRDTIMRMLLQTSNKVYPLPNEDRTQFSLWTDDRLWIYNQLDQVPFDRILGMVKYSASKIGAKHVVVDSLMKCGVDDSDYDGQKNFVDHLSWAAKTFNVHIHLVAHMRKRGSENDMPGKFDVFGSSAITNLADQVLAVWRNKEKEQAIKNGMIWNGDCKHDVVLRVLKNRHSGAEDDFGLQFQELGKGFGRYLGSDTDWNKCVDYRTRRETLNERSA